MKPKKRADCYLVSDASLPSACWDTIQEDPVSRAVDQKWRGLSENGWRDSRGRDPPPQQKQPWRAEAKGGADSPPGGRRGSPAGHKILPPLSQARPCSQGVGSCHSADGIKISPTRRNVTERYNTWLTRSVVSDTTDKPAGKSSKPSTACPPPQYHSAYFAQTQKPLKRSDANRTQKGAGRVEGDALPKQAGPDGTARPRCAGRSQTDGSADESVDPASARKQRELGVGCLTAVGAGNSEPSGCALLSSAEIVHGATQPTGRPGSNAASNQAPPDQNAQTGASSADAQAAQKGSETQGNATQPSGRSVSNAAGNQAPPDQSQKEGDPQCTAAHRHLLARPLASAVSGQPPAAPSAEAAGCFAAKRPPATTATERKANRQVYEQSTLELRLVEAERRIYQHCKNHTWLRRHAGACAVQRGFRCHVARRAARRKKDGLGPVGAGLGGRPQKVRLEGVSDCRFASEFDRRMLATRVLQSCGRGLAARREALPGLLLARRVLGFVRQSLASTTIAAFGRARLSAAGAAARLTEGLLASLRLCTDSACAIQRQWRVHTAGRADARTRKLAGIRATAERRVRAAAFAAWVGLRPARLRRALAVLQERAVLWLRLRAFAALRRQQRLAAVGRLRVRNRVRLVRRYLCRWAQPAEPTGAPPFRCASSPARSEQGALDRKLPAEAPGSGPTDALPQAASSRGGEPSALDRKLPAARVQVPGSGSTDAPPQAVPFRSASFSARGEPSVPARASLQLNGLASRTSVVSVMISEPLPSGAEDDYYIEEEDDVCKQLHQSQMKKLKSWKGTRPESLQDTDKQSNYGSVRRYIPEASESAASPTYPGTAFDCLFLTSPMYTTSERVFAAEPSCLDDTTTQRRLNSVASGESAQITVLKRKNVRLLLQSNPAPEENTGLAALERAAEVQILSLTQHRSSRISEHGVNARPEADDDDGRASVTRGSQSDDECPSSQRGSISSAGYPRSMHASASCLRNTNPRPNAKQPTKAAFLPHPASAATTPVHSLGSPSPSRADLSEDRGITHDDSVASQPPSPVARELRARLPEAAEEEGSSVQAEPRQEDRQRVPEPEERHALAGGLEADDSAAQEPMGRSGHGASTTEQPNDEKTLPDATEEGSSVLAEPRQEDRQRVPEPEEGHALAGELEDSATQEPKGRSGHGSSTAQPNDEKTLPDPPLPPAVELQQQVEGGDDATPTQPQDPGQRVDCAKSAIDLVTGVEEEHCKHGFKLVREALDEMDRADESGQTDQAKGPEPEPEAPSQQEPRLSGSGERSLTAVQAKTSSGRRASDGHVDDASVVKRLEPGVDDEEATRGREVSGLTKAEGESRQQIVHGERGSRLDVLDVIGAPLIRSLQLRIETAGGTKKDRASANVGVQPTKEAQKYRLSITAATGEQTRVAVDPAPARLSAGQATTGYSLNLVLVADTSDPPCGYPILQLLHQLSAELAAIEDRSAKVIQRAWRLNRARHVIKQLRCKRGRQCQTLIQHGCAECLQSVGHGASGRRKLGAKHARRQRAMALENRNATLVLRRYFASLSVLHPGRLTDKAVTSDSTHPSRRNSADLAPASINYHDVCSHFC
ncbi:hypothetical protein DIPPA_21812 [Diplonema papillatum]|nr:hypothetical protein DIPPA_21812 [Diplonema papillatum]